MPMIRFYDTYPTGAPLVGGKLYTSQPGTVAGPGQSFPKATYTDSSGTVPNANPVILDGSGKATVWLSGNYSMVVYDATGILIESQNNVGGSGGGSGAGGGDNVSFNDASLATVNVAIPSANDLAAVSVLVFKTDNSGNPAVITPVTGTILGQPTYNLTSQNEWVRLIPQAAGNDWKRGG
jgi:hypothetical protein